ncbi:MAG: HAMP domain-containing histidine kinase [Acidimicrobiia bacterium]|nr:HAMP domain-containing histidine kinase [Acidimicrobiia bacterium]
MGRTTAETTGTTGRPRWDRSLGLTVFTGIAMLVVLGLVFSVAYGSRQITTSAAALHDADEGLRAATIVRAQLALGVHLASVDREFGTNSVAAQQVSIEESTVALADLTTAVEELVTSGKGADTTLIVAAERLIDTSGDIIANLVAGDSIAAQTASGTRLDADFRGLTGVLVEVRDVLAEDVSASDALLGRIGNFARFLVAFLIPAAVILVYRELMKRQQRQAELENRLEAERQLNTAREEFVANASHELRTPLTSIVGLSVLLAENEAVAAEPAAAELLGIIISESDDLARMVEDLLTTARLDAGALHFVFDDVDVETEMPETIDPLVRSGPSIGLSVEPGIIRTDRLRFRQLLRNLLSNARKYGGENIRVEGRVEGRTYVCAVIDDGPGVPTEIEDRLFERFIHQGHQTATKDSVGLGLSIVHALTQGMGGSISYDRLNGETHFTIRVPLAGSGELPTQLVA